LVLTLASPSLGEIAALREPVADVCKRGDYERDGDECHPRQGLGDKAKKVPSIPVPDFVARMAALFDPIVRGRLYEPGKRRPVSSEKAREMLRWMPRPVTTTVLDTARSLQAANLV
jgi:hypothetical protein